MDTKPDYLKAEKFKETEQKKDDPVRKPSITGQVDDFDILEGEEQKQGQEKLAGPDPDEDSDDGFDIL